MKRVFTAASMIVALLILAQGQSQTNARRNEPPVDCGAYPAQATSLYILPWRVGESYEIIRTTSHYTRGNRGVGLNAVDIRMPIGTTIVATRAGIVVAVQEDYADGNGVDLQENYVFIKHSDGTLSRYFHLTRQGALVAVGDSVQQGDVIARSGNSGDSGESHLHFDVQVCGVNLPPNYNQLPCGQTLPVTFRNTDPHACGLTPGMSYVARRFNVQSPGSRRRTQRSGRTSSTIPHFPVS